jgi:hypothetical protein
LLLRKPNQRHVNVHQSLVSQAWTAEVRALVRGIREFAVLAGPAHDCRISLFEMPGDSLLHVNVTHGREKRPVKGWAGPGIAADGFIHNRRFEAGQTDAILRQIRQMVFAAPA